MLSLYQLKINMMIDGVILVILGTTIKERVDGKEVVIEGGEEGEVEEDKVDVGHEEVDHVEKETEEVLTLVVD